MVTLEFDSTKGPQDLLDPLGCQEIMETMAIMEQLARKEPKVRKETKEIWDQGESVAIMDPKARRVTLGSLQSYRLHSWLQWLLTSATRTVGSSSVVLKLMLGISLM